MRLLRCLPAILLVTILLACGGVRKAAQWKTYQPRGRKAEIQFPGTPTETIEKDGNYDLTLETQGGEVDYTLMYHPLHQKIDFEAEEVKDVLDETVEDVAKDVKGTVVSRRDIKLGKYPGRAIGLDVPPNDIARVRLYLTASGAYVIFVTGPREAVEGADATRFLESFKILE